MKIELFKSSYVKFNLWDMLIIFDFNKNVQGYYFTRNWSVYWLRYCLNFSIVKTNYTFLNSDLAHSLNVKKYIK